MTGRLLSHYYTVIRVETRAAPFSATECNFSLAFLHQFHQTSQHNGAHIWSNGIDFAIPALRSAQEPWRLIIPFGFRNQIPQFIIAQAEDKLIPALQAPSQDRFKGRIRIVGSGIAGDASVGELWIDLPGNCHNLCGNTLRTPKLDVVHFGLQVVACGDSNRSSTAECFLDGRCVYLPIGVQRLATGEYTGSFRSPEMIVLEWHEQHRFPYPKRVHRRRL